MYYNKSNKAKEEIKMIKTIELLLDEKGMLDGFLPVPLNGRTYYMEVEFLIEDAADLSKDRLEVHAKRLMNADFYNDRNELIFALQMMAREVLRKKPELLTNA